MLLLGNGVGTGIFLTLNNNIHVQIDYDIVPADRKHFQREESILNTF